MVAKVIGGDWSQRFRAWANEPGRGFATRGIAVLWGLLIAFSGIRLVVRLFSDSTSTVLRVVDIAVLLIGGPFLAIFAAARRHPADEERSGEAFAQGDRPGG